MHRHARFVVPATAPVSPRAAVASVGAVTPPASRAPPVPFPALPRSSLLSTAVADSYICLMHLVAGVIWGALFNSFATISFTKLMLFSILEMRLMLVIWKSRRADAFANGWNEMRWQLVVLYSRFYGALIAGLFFLYQFWVSGRAASTNDAVPAACRRSRRRAALTLLFVCGCCRAACRSCCLWVSRSGCRKSCTRRTAIRPTASPRSTLRSCRARGSFCPSTCSGVRTTSSRCVRPGPRACGRESPPRSPPDLHLPAWLHGCLVACWVA